MRAHRVGVFLLTLIPAAAASVAAQTEPLQAAAWRTRDVAVGMRWRQARLVLFAGPQQVSVLEIRRGDPEVRFTVAAPERGLVATSAMAERAGAAAAVNGGFFAKDGSATGLLLVDGALRQPAGARNPAALAVRGGRLELVATAMLEPDAKAPERDAHDSTSPIEHALAAGPWLVRGGDVVARPEGPRHPRTAVGTDARTVFLVTVDGRADEARGMTLHELAQVMVALGCSEAFNLDGGGSTTMWVRSLGGVVNCPCDDKRFDPAGERAVGNAVLVHGRAIWTRDEESAVLAPADAFAAAVDAACTDGDCVVSSDGGSATFDLGDVALARAAVEVFTRKGDRVAWTLCGREGAFEAQATGWLVLDDFVPAETGQRKLTLSSTRAFAVDAVRLVDSRE